MENEMDQLTVSDKEDQTSDLALMGGPLTPSRKKSPSESLFKSSIKTSSDDSFISSKKTTKKQYQVNKEVFFIVVNKLVSLLRHEIKIIANKLKQLRESIKLINEHREISVIKERLDSLTIEEAEHILVVANTIHCVWKIFNVPIKQDNSTEISQFCAVLRLILELDDVPPILPTVSFDKQ